MTPIRQVPDVGFGTVKERVGIQSTPESRAMSPDINEPMVNSQNMSPDNPFIDDALRRSYELEYDARRKQSITPPRPTPEVSTPQRYPDPMPRERNPFPQGEEFYYDPFRGYTKVSEKNRYKVPDESIDSAPPDFAPPLMPDPNFSAQNRYKNDGTLKALEDQLNHQRNTYSPITGMVTMKNGGRVQSSTKKSGERVQSYTNKSGGINLGSGRVSTASKNSKTPKW